jgi:hypothetical protein
MTLRDRLARLKQFLAHRVLHVDDTPHRIALGVAIGVFAAWMPAMGLQVLVVLALATLLRANKLVGLPFVWISNPLTFVPVYLPSYLLGSYLLGSRLSMHDFRTAITRAMSGSGTWWGHIQAWWQAVAPFLAPLWVGSILVGLVLGAIAYALVYYLVATIRRRRDYRLLRRRQRYEVR